MIIKNPLIIKKAKLQAKTATPTTSSQTIVADSGYDGLSEVQVEAVTSSIDSNITAGNIKKDVTILGVTGTLEEGTTPAGTINITENGTYDVTNYANANVNVQSGGIPEPIPTSVSLFDITGNTITNYIGSEKDVVIPLSYSKSTRTGFSDGVELIPPDYNYVFGSLSSQLAMMEFEYDTTRKTYTSFTVEFYSQLEQDFPNGCFLIHAQGSLDSLSFIDNIRYVDINVNGKLFTGELSGTDAFDYIRQNYIETIQFKGDYVDEIIVDGADFPITNMESASGYYNNISNLTILDNITSIAEQTFGNTNLDTITVDPKNPKYISKGNCLIDKDTNVLIAGSNNSIIPEEVTSIGSHAFFCCRSLTTLTIPNSVTSIGRSAFSSCSKLTTVTIGSGVTSIESSTFTNCGSLTTITIPNSVTSIGDSAFSGCSSLASITIPNSVTSIGYYAFQYCSSLISATIGSSVTSIGYAAFSDCSSLEKIEVVQGNTKYSSVGNCLIETGSNTLIAGCKNSVIPTDGSVTSIGGSAFYGCSSLTSINIPDSVKSIGGSAFSGCSGLTSVTIDNGVISIGSQAFRKCSGLTSISIPDSVTSIGAWAFNDCSRLTSVTIGSSVTSIKQSAFYDCSKLTTITLLPTTPPTLEYTNAISSATTTIYIPKGTLSAYQSATNWSSFASKFVELSA